jgi:hypothetical protein
LGGTAITTSTISIRRNPSVTAWMSASCHGMRAAVVPLNVTASLRAATSSSGLGPVNGTANAPHGIRASRALGEMNSTGRGSATDADSRVASLLPSDAESSCQAGAAISSTPRM